MHCKEQINYSKSSIFKIESNSPFIINAHTFLEINKIVTLCLLNQSEILRQDINNYYI